MDLKKAGDQLWRLVDEEPNDLAKYAQVDALLRGFERANEDLLGEGRPDSYAIEKIETVRTSFQILCGIGEDGRWTERKLRDDLRNDVSGLQRIVDSDNPLHLNTPMLFELNRRASENDD